ncbi:MAG: 6-phosphofructokinase [Lachnospiraceae bacterium]|nr:6-phosphofructokinase [Lachnospiraceae bacterium]
MSKKNVIVGQSGGPTSVINSSLYGVVTGFLGSEKIDKIYGMVNGIEGFLAGKTTVLSDLSKEELEILQTTPASYLKSCRFKLPEDLNDPVYPTLLKKFEEMNIGYFFYIGGNDSMDTVSKLSRYGEKVGTDMIFMGVPKTIDNDLIITDHTPGYGSAAKYVATTVRECALDAGVYAAPCVTVVEIMGRHAGWLTAASVLARKFEGDAPHLIYLPETAFEMDQCLADVKKCLEKTNNVVVCISEGIADKNGKFICEYGGGADGAVDSFGHKKLTGSGKYLSEVIGEKLSVKVRSLEFSIIQRCGASLASATDIEEAAMAGSVAAKAALEGKTGMMVAFIREPGDEYRISYQLTDVNEVCNKEKPFPAEWITDNGTNIGEGYVKYALPLIQGASPVKLVNGLPAFLDLATTLK